MAKIKRKDHDKYWLISLISVVLGESINTSQGDVIFSWNVGDTDVTLWLDKNELSVTLVDWDSKLSITQDYALSGIASSFNLERTEYINEKQ
jgi:hypothetical protein